MLHFNINIQMIVIYDEIYNNNPWMQSKPVRV